MSVFLFIILPLIVEGITVAIMGFDMDYEPVWLIAFGIYLISAIIVRASGKKLLKHKISFAFLFVLLPVFTLFLITAASYSWYDDVYYKNKSTAKIYLYNESSVENIYAVKNTRDITFDSPVDKYYNLFNLPYKPVNLMNYYTDSSKKIYGGYVRCLKVRPGTYSLQILSENKETKKDYITLFNEESITVTADKPVFLCFGGKNFFEFTPDANDANAIITKTQELKKDIGNYSIKWEKTVDLPQGAPRSVKTVIEK